MNNILIISDARSKFMSLLDLAILLKNKNNVTPFFYFDDSTDKLYNELEVCKQMNLNYFYNTIDNIKIINHESIISKFKNKFSIKTSLINYYKNKLICTNTFLKENKITSIIATEDNYGISTFIIAAANKKKISTFVFPFLIANQEEIGYAYSKIEGHEINKKPYKLFYKLFPKWFVYYNNKKYFLLKPFEIIAQKIVKIAPKNVFIGVGGNSKIKIFESKFMLDYYLKSGFKKTKETLILGSLKLDKLSNSIGINLYEENINSDKKIILCALPPDYYPNNHYKSYQEIITHWLSLFCNQNTHQVIVSLHPRTKIEDVEFIKQYNIIIAKKSIEFYIPVCDVFIANLSATIRYALACNKKILNFDFVNVNYSDYKNIKQVKTVFNKYDFETSFNEILLQEDFEQKESNYFGVLDGKSHERILNILNAA